MSKYHEFYNTVNNLASYGIEQGILQLYTEDRELYNNIIKLQGREIVNFGSCSYLGLEFDERLKKGAIDAISQYGTQFSSARIYLSSKHYLELESTFYRVFNANTLVAPTTTLAHIACIPVVINDDDAIILDHQVHNTVQTAVNIVKTRGVHVEMIRHSNINMLEEKIKELKQKYRRIWYMADGIYSMYGDFCPLNSVMDLMKKYPELFLYIDDAHGMSCFGKNGAGSVLNSIELNDNIFLVTSLNKAFACGGSAIITTDDKLLSKIRNTGSPFLSSGPLQPANLGAAIACAQIHLSNEIYQLQEDLQENIRYTNLMLKKYNLPNVSENNSPVFFVGVSLPKVGFNMIKRLLNEGYYTNIGVFPTVPMKNTGIRFTITRLHTFSQIEAMVSAMAYHYPLGLEEEGFSMEKVYRAFKMSLPEDKQAEKFADKLVSHLSLNIQHETTINKIDKTEWNKLLGENGSFDWDAMQLLEKSFSGNCLPEENWLFDYLIIRDKQNTPVLATFFTSALAKDDMLSPASVSEKIEELRVKNVDPYYLTSRLLTMGSLLTEGEHLYLNKEHALYKQALFCMFEKINHLQEKYAAEVIQLRDFENPDKILDELMTDNGFFKVGLPENNISQSVNSAVELLDIVSKRSKKHLKQDVIKYEKFYTTEVIKNPSDDEINIIYDLYSNVKDNSFSLNTFQLPKKFFNEIFQSANWEVILLKLKHIDKVVAVAISYKTTNNYNFVLVGLDYSYNREYNCYRQAIYRVLLRAGELRKKSVRLGFSATVEKRKFGAKVYNPVAYMQVKDHFNMEVLANMTVSENK